MTTYIYPGRFDPFTRGHEDIAIRASRLCDHLVVAVAGVASERSFLLELKSRLELCRKILSPHVRIRVIELTELLVDCAGRVDADAIVKGIRQSRDLAREQQMASINHHLMPELETVCLLSRARYSHISSSMVKELARYPQTNLIDMVDPVVIPPLLDALKQVESSP